MTNPVIITLAINGETSKKRNPHVPQKPEEIVADAVACFGAGVAVVHNHMGDINLTGQAAAERYALAWAPIRAAVPDAILCPTTQQAADLDERLAVAIVSATPWSSSARTACRYRWNDPSVISMSLPKKP